MQLLNELIWDNNHKHILEALNETEKLEYSIKKLNIKKFTFDNGEIVDFEFKPEWDYDSIAASLAIIFEKKNLIIHKI